MKKPSVHRRAISCGDNWVERLQAAVIIQATKDYRKAIRAARGQRVPRPGDKCPIDYAYNLDSLHRFFRSRYGELLCCGKGAYVAERIEQEERYAECNFK